MLVFTSCIHRSSVDSEDTDIRKMYTGSFNVHFIEMGGDWAYPQTQFHKGH